MAMSMSHYRIVQRPDESNSALAAQAIACPACGAGFVFCRSGEPVIDACGFESFALECQECGAALAGIVDPADDTLLISALAA